MAKIDALRKLIREEVVAALRQELPRLIKEANQSKSGIANVIKETKKAQFPLTLNTEETYKLKPQNLFSNSSPLDALLNETAMSMNSYDADVFSSNDTNAMSIFQPREVSVGDVNTMIATARPSSDISMVQINEVPDYTGLMKNLMDKGAI